MSPRPVASTLPARAAGHFLAPRETAPLADPAIATSRFAPRAAVLGTPADAPPVAAALANALRAAHRSPAAVVAVWAPPAGVPPLDATAPGPQPIAPAESRPRGGGTVAAPAESRPRGGGAVAAPTESRPRGGGAVAAPERPPSAPSAPAARRVAARLTLRGLPSAARGRVVWLPLPKHPVAAGLAARRAAGALDLPVVVAFGGPRTGPLEGLLGEQDLIVVVTREPDGPLARLALTGWDVPAVACPPLSAAARVLALAGLAGARALAEPVRAAAGAVAGGPAPRPFGGSVDPTGAVEWTR